MENIYRKYNTQAIILSNYEIDYSDIPDNLSNDLLFTIISNKMDIDLNSYYRWLYTTKDILPASNRYVSMDSNKVKYKTDEISGDIKEIYELKEMMQYKLFIENSK